MLQKFLTPGRWSASATDWASLILRLTLGFLMITHGYEKLQTLIGGGKIEFPDPIHVGATASLALTVFSEFFCSLMIIFGLWTRLALIPLIFTMCVIVGIMDWGSTLADKEHALLYLLPYIALFLLGSGKFSMDDKLRREVD
jgi:putative oxidoreductase